MSAARAPFVLTCLTLAATALVAQQPVPGFADAILGPWDLTVQGGSGPYPSWLEILLRKETELMGRFVGQFGSNRHVAETSYRDGNLLVRIPVQYEQHTSDLVFKGHLAGDRLEGTTEDAAGKTLTWAGVRAPALHRASAPTWGTPLDLFNGKDLAGWTLRTQSRGSCWSVAAAAMTNAPPCVDIVTERAFTDFRLHAELNYVPGSNSGIYLRGRYEVQIQDDAAKAADSLRMGGVYGFLRPAVNASGAPGAWQAFDITLVGRRVTVALNGRTIIDNLEIPGITGGALDSHEGAAGPLMLQGDHGKVMFRRIVLTPAMYDHPMLKSEPRTPSHETRTSDLEREPGTGNREPGTARSGVSRRAAIKALGTSAGVVVLLPSLSNEGLLAFRALQEAKAPPNLKVLSPAQFATLDAFAEAIIPADERSPGAKQARVADFIDLLLSESDHDVRLQWFGGLAALDAEAVTRFRAPFATLDAVQADMMLAAISARELAPETPLESFFVTTKHATIQGYYTSEIGIHQELKYKGNQFLKEFVGCATEDGKDCPHCKQRALGQGVAHAAVGPNFSSAETEN